MSHYKQVVLTPFKFSGIDGKETVQNLHGQIAVGIFEKEDSQSYTVLCVIDKNVGDIEEQTQEACKIANLLNNNRKFFTKKEVDVKQLPVG